MLGGGDGRDKKGFKKSAAALTLKGESALWGRRQVSRQWGPLVQRCSGLKEPLTELLTAGAEHTDCPCLFRRTSLRKLCGSDRFARFPRRLCPTNSKDASTALNYQKLGLLHKTGPKGLPPGSG